MEEWVYMRHPETGGYTTCTKEAFETVWQEKGWVLAEAPPPVTEEAAAPAVVDQSPAPAGE